MPTDSNEWRDWSKFVLKELERLNNCQEESNRKLNEIKTEIVALQVKSGIWGAIGGMIPIFVLIAIKVFERLQ